MEKMPCFNLSQISEGMHLSHSPLASSFGQTGKCEGVTGDV